MPYKDQEKKKEYNRNYRKKERELVKQLRAEQKKKLDSSVQKDAGKQ
jgi:hypothetical protein